jgi:hypothetical protein
MAGDRDVASARDVVDSRLSCEYSAVSARASRTSRRRGVSTHRGDSPLEEGHGEITEGTEEEETDE